MARSKNSPLAPWLIAQIKNEETGDYNVLIGFSKTKGSGVR